MGEMILFFKSDTVPNEDRFVFESEPTLVLDKFEFLNKEIDRLVSLNVNWDKQGGLPVLNEVGEISKKLFAMTDFIEGISDIFPNPHGTLTIEWTNNQKEKLALEIGANSYSYFIKYLDKKPKLVDGKNILMDTQMLTKDLGELFSEEVLNFIL